MEAIVFAVLTAMEAIVFALWIGFAVLTAMAAASRGRHVVGWAVAGFVFGLFALIAVLVVGKSTQRRMEEETMRAKVWTAQMGAGTPEGIPSKAPGDGLSVNWSLLIVVSFIVGLVMVGTLLRGP